MWISNPSISAPNVEVERHHGWVLLAHPQFEDQWASWTNHVYRLAKKDPNGFTSHPMTKRLATVEKLVFDVIPSDPSHRMWRQGNTLGPENRAWRRAKFGGRYRLFFRFDSSSKIIIYGWINDEESLRARGSKHDPYTIFAKMLSSGNPPSTWDELLHDSAQLSEKA